MADARRVDMEVARLAYSRNAGVMRGASGSASRMRALVLPGMMTRKIPPKNSHAASHASIARAVVSSKVG
jgi:hypothetical protein